MMNKTQIIIGGVRAAEFKVKFLTKVSSKLNDIMLIAKEPDHEYMPDHMCRRVITERDYKFRCELTKKITWRGFRIIHGRLDKIYLIEDEILDERDVLKRINL